jgi:hypothetical protein
MTQTITEAAADAQHADIQITLNWPQAVRLRMTLPWLLHALEERPTTPARHRERRRIAHEALEDLLTTLSSQLEHAEADHPTQ